MGLGRWAWDTEGWEAGPKPVETQCGGMGGEDKWESNHNIPVVCHKSGQIAKRPNFVHVTVGTVYSHCSSYNFGQESLVSTFIISNGC